MAEILPIRWKTLSDQSFKKNRTQNYLFLSSESWKQTSVGLISFHISISKAVYIKILDVGSMCSRQLSTSLLIEKKSFKALF